jgi:hypothetical protein
MDLPRADAAQILLLGERPAEGVDQLKVLRVQLTCPFHISTDQRAETLAFGYTKELRIIIGDRGSIRAGHAGTS